MHTLAKADFIDIFVKKILAPRNLNYKIMFCGPTGTNAIEAALKLARKNTKRENILAFSGAFHGMSLGSLSITTDKLSRRGAGIPLTNVTFVPFETSDFNSINYIRNILDDDHSGIELPAAIVLETVQAEGGINVASVKWLKEIRKICDEYGILLIVDDIQVGNGRSGNFFSFERASIIPDIVVVSKSISGFGLPMSILLVKPEYDIFKPAEHNGTFRGNQLSFIGAKAAIEFFINNKLDEQTIKKGQIIEEVLRTRITNQDYRLRHRGIGMIWGIDFSMIDSTMALKCVHAAFENGLILEVAGRKDSVLKIMPPLTIEEKILKEGLAILEKCIKNVLS